jgi:hypothetical protein
LVTRADWLLFALQQENFKFATQNAKTMKQEFMLYIRNAGDAKSALTTDEHFEFIKRCEVYIERLKAEDKLIAAQPLIREGVIVSRNGDNWKDAKIDASKEVQVGYYHIKAKDLAEAVAMAKENPEFEFIPSATIEVRPVKMKEKKTSFVYPT